MSEPIEREPSETSHPQPGRRARVASQLAVAAAGIGIASPFVGLGSFLLLGGFVALILSLWALSTRRRGDHVTLWLSIAALAVVLVSAAGVTLLMIGLSKWAEHYS